MSKDTTLQIAIDLISHAYKTSEPLLIAEKIYEDLGICVTVHQVTDYLDINKLEDFEKESQVIQYQSVKNN